VASFPLRLPAGVLSQLARDVEDEVLRTVPQDDKDERSQEQRAEIRRFTNDLLAALARRGWRYREQEWVKIWSDDAATPNPWAEWPVLSSVEHLVLDGFWNFDPRWWMIIHFIEKCGSATGPQVRCPQLSIILDYAPASEANLFLHFDALWSEFESRSRRSSSVTTVCEGARCACAVPKDCSAEVYEAPNLESEVEYVAMRLREALEARPAEAVAGESAFTGTAVCVPDLGNYYPQIRSVFREHGIRFRAPQVLELTATPVWELLTRVSALTGSLRSNKLSLTDLDHLLEHPWVHFLFPQWGRTEASSYRFVRRVLPSVATLEDLIRFLKHQLVEAERPELTDEDAFEFLPKQRQRDLMLSLVSLRRQLRPYLSQAPSSHWFDLFYRVLHATLWRLSSWLRKRAQSPDGGANAREGFGRTADDVRLVTACVARLVACLKRYHAVLSAFCPEQLFSCSDYLDGLMILLEPERVADRVRPHGCVQIISPAEALGQHHDLVVFMGLIDGVMPRFSTYRRSSPYPSPLSAQETELSEQRFIFLQIVRTARHAIITYPKRDGEIELLPSQFITMLVEGHENSLPALAKFVEQSSLQTVLGAKQRINKIAQILSDSAAGHPSVGSADNVTTNEAASTFSDALPAALGLLSWCGAAQMHRRASFLSPFEGEVASIFPSLAPTFLRDHVYTAYELQDMVDCPLQYLFKHVLNVMPPQREEFAAARQFGQLVHKILFLFMSAMRDAGFVDLRSADAVEPGGRALLKLVETAALELKQHFADTPVELLSLVYQLIGAPYAQALVQELDPKLMAVAQRLQSFSIAGQNKAQKGLLIAFLEHEIARNWSGQSPSRTGEPTLLEWRFGFEDPGTGEDGPVEVVATNGRRAFAIKLRGIVDRVDVLPGAAPTFWVIDYKTGGACPTKTQLIEGGVVQLPLYALATCSARPEFGECAGLAYYHLTRSEMKLVSVPGSRNQTSAVEIIEKAISRLARQMELISQGHFFPLGVQRQKSKSYCEKKCPFYLISCFGVADPLLVSKIDRLSANKKEDEASCPNDG
jgi:hypothetical protein